jgi:Carbohydrate-binding family 9
MQDETTIEATWAAGELAAGDFECAAWDAARPVLIARLWSGEDAPPSRHAEARAVWTREALSVRFVCRQEEPLVVAARPRFDEKSIGLWDRDVCELFVAPDAERPERYFEFEAAPTGEWLDLALTKTDAGRETDWGYRSGMTAAARVGEGVLTVGLRVPWSAFGREPRAGESWRANLYRCVGLGATRYLAWRPTRTPEPNFHVPEAFGRLDFVEGG